MNRRNTNTPKRKQPIAIGYSGSSKPGRNLEKRMVKTAGQISKVSRAFGVKEARHITTLLKDGNVDGSIMAFQRTAYASIINLISVAEAEYIKGRREHQAYVLNSLISTGRELAADVGASAARQDLANIIAREVLEPMFRTLLQDVMTEQVQMKAILSDKVPDKHVDGVTKEMDSSLKRLAAKMTDHFHNTSAAIAERMT